MSPPPLVPSRIKEIEALALLVRIKSNGPLSLLYQRMDVLSTLEMYETIFDYQTALMPLNVRKLPNLVSALAKKKERPSEAAIAANERSLNQGHC